jgi:hypothetical protein
MSMFQRIAGFLKRTFTKPKVTTPSRIPYANVHRVAEMPNRKERRRRLKALGYFKKPRFLQTRFKCTRKPGETLTLRNIVPLYGRRSQR